MTESTPPILRHALEQQSAFTPENLIEDVRRSRQIPAGIVPPLCILEFDGDITDWLVRDGIAKRFAPWACFHTSMYTMDLEGVACGIIARTIGGPFAVLIAEQLQAAGAKLIVGLTSAGRVVSRSTASVSRGGNQRNSRRGNFVSLPAARQRGRVQVAGGAASRAGVARHRMGRPVG